MSVWQSKVKWKERLKNEQSEKLSTKKSKLKLERRLLQSMHSEKSWIGRKAKRKSGVRSVRLPANGGDSEVSDESICALCYPDDPGHWISCDACDLWYHLSCVGLPDTITAVQEWRCQSCDH